MSMEIPTSSRIKLSVDRLSGLQDDILCQILSFLLTKDSVKTSALSRRWRLLWTHVPKLDFYDSVCEEEASFSEILNRVFLQYKAHSLSTLNLYVPEDEFTDYELETWINFAIARNLQDLFLSLHHQVALPRRIFTCKTLVYLKLYCYGTIPMTSTIWLPRLKTLHLDAFVCESNGSVPRLLSGCPILKELSLVYELEWEDSDCWYISSSTIKTLSLKCEYPNCDFLRVEIDTPALRYLRVDDWPLRFISFGPLTSLIEANIDLSISGSWNWRKLEDDSLRDVLHCRSLVENVGSLCHVKSLNLSCSEKLVDSIAFAPWTIRFNNLTKLQWRADWRLLSKIIETADNLQVLIIEQVPEHLHCWTEPQQVPKCLLLHLRAIEIPRFTCQENEFEMVQYLLRNAQVLKRMEIKSPFHDMDIRFNALRRISMFQRRSMECELDFI